MLTVTVNSKPVDDLLTQLLGRMDDLQPAMQGIGQELNSRISARFETRSDPMGRAWAPWAESTRENYPKDGRGLLLERYGDMLKSLNFQADSTAVRVGFGAVASKKGDVYAAYHEWGTVKMPRRGLLFADPDAGTLAPGDEAAVLDIISGFLLPG
ncbi:MAG: phage virion morphogenesis protein [Pseudomonadota bacterium]